MAKKPSTSEEEYFARQEREREAEEEIRKRHAAREERRRMHFMKCPKCGADLATQLFHDVEIDRCGECKGVWLDAGELEKLAGRESHMLDDLFAFFRGKRA